MTTNVFQIGTPNTSTPRILCEDKSRGRRVIRVDPGSDPRWELFVNSHPDSSIYHHPGWLGSLNEEYKGRDVHLACEDQEGRLLGVLPLFYTRGLAFNAGLTETGRRLSSLPRTPLGGPLSVTRGATCLLLKAAMDLSRQYRGVQIQLKTQSQELDGLVDGLVRTPWTPSYVLELPENPDNLRFGNSVTRHRIKWAVNKATKLGVQVRTAERDTELRCWYSLYLHAMRRHAVPPRPYRFFLAMWKYLMPRGMMRLLLAEQNRPEGHRLLAGSIFLMFGRTVAYAFTGCDPESFSFHANDIIQWQAIHDACRRGYRWYDFGEVPEEHQRLAQFKAKWGAETVPHFRYYYPASRSSELPEATCPRLARRVLVSVWQRLPLGVTACLGDWIYCRL